MTAYERLMARVLKSDGCWEWQGAKNSAGYGVISTEKRRLTTGHRLMWTHQFGPIPDGMFVLHRCDNPPCVRPDHLFLGTNADNIADASAKGRLSAAQRRRAKLSVDHVLAIRARVRAGEMQRRIAREYGVSETLISDVVRHVAWRNA